MVPTFLTACSHATRTTACTGYTWPEGVTSEGCVGSTNRHIAVVNSCALAKNVTMQLLHATLARRLWSHCHRMHLSQPVHSSLLRFRIRHSHEPGQLQWRLREHRSIHSDERRTMLTKPSTNWLPRTNLLLTNRMPADWRMHRNRSTMG
jgi:hypothetical protein